MPLDYDSFDALTFDCYGTLIDWEAGLLAALRAVLPGIARADDELLEEYARLYRDFPFPEKQTTGYRYFYDNDWFGHSDAIFLYCFLRKRKPRKIIEVGSGYSSAVTLDTVDRFFSQRPEITFIDPYPVRLLSLLTEGDQEHVRLIDQKIQDVPVDLLLTLESGDLRQVLAAVSTPRRS
jgi:predicted O-methyltransferase YrrM